MYFAAFVVPDIINYMLAGGFMSITIIPLLAKGFNEDENDAWNFFSCIFFWMLAASLLLTGLGEIFALKLAYLIAPGFTDDQYVRLAFFMRLILPAQVFFLCGACFTALLLLRRQFAVPALTPLIYNGSIILFGITLPLIPGMPDNLGMTGYCIGVTIGAATGAFLLPFIVSVKGQIRLTIQLYHPWLRKFLLIALPLMLGQTVVMLDEQFLRVFGSMLNEGGISALNYGRRISQVPVALMGQAIAAASYPFLVKLLSQNETVKFNQTLNSALSTGLALIIPCALLMIAAAQPILGIIFQGGRFGASETLICTPITRILLAATPFWILYMVLARAFYAYGDTLTPAITGTVITLFCVPAYYLLGVPLGANAIAAISGISVAVYSIWLLWIWIKRQGNLAFIALPKVCIKCFIFALPGTILAWCITNLLLPQILPLSTISGMLLRLCIAAASFLLLFLIIVKIFDPQFGRALLQNLWHKK